MGSGQWTVLSDHYPLTAEMSIRLRLTLWYVFLLAVILVLFSGILFAILSFSLLDEVDRTLQSRADLVQNGIDAALQAQSDIRAVIARRIFIPPAESFATPGVYVQLSLLDGTTNRSENMGDRTLAILPTTLDRIKNGENVFVTQTVDGIPIRSYLSPLNVRSQVVGVIQVAEPLQSVYVTLRRLAILLGLGIFGGLVLASAVGAFLANSALSPIDHMTQSARTIAHSGDLTRRINPPKTKDEVDRLATTFNEMLERIEELFRAQQRFVADVSHELRSPLTAIRGNLDLLKRVASDDVAGRQEAFTAIDSESSRMQRLVQDLLLLAQADAGVELQKQNVELDSLLLDVYRHAKLVANGVKVSLGNWDQVQVLGDADRLKQLLINLADNAIKYTPSDGEVKIALERDADWVRVSITDTGVGIPAQDLPKIFDRFYRVDRARSREKGGTGLGLAICKWIVDAHGGKIDVASEVGKGTTFNVSLPTIK